jgi:hypothetical protein
MPKAQYAVFRAPGDWTAAEYDEYDGPELGKKFKDYARRKVGGRGAQAETVFTRKLVAAAPAAPAAPVVEVDESNPAAEEDAVMAALAAGMAGMGVGAGAAPPVWGGEGNMQEGGRRYRKSHKAGRRSRRSKSRRHHSRKNRA